jgi:hypothetical protein
MVTLHHPTHWNGMGQLPSLSLLCEPQMSQMHYKIIFNSFFFIHSYAMMLEKFLHEKQCTVDLY